MKNPANPVLWIVIALPLIAVAASLASLALAVTRGDAELPASYHWEGDALERDQQRLSTAAQRGISATLAVDGAAQRCIVELHGAAPPALLLTLTHPTLQGADRHVRLLPVGTVYAANCAALPAAHWWVQLADEQGQWLLRARVQGALQSPAALDSAAPANREAH
jgi:hypothetical protein